MPERSKPRRLAFDAKKLKTLTDAAAKEAARGAGVRIVFDGADPDERVLAVEALAKKARLKVERIDLARVVAQGIGETEKNLKALIKRADPAAALLLFDEADALFGRRAQVEDAHGRYANLETSYLKALAKFTGLAVVSVAASPLDYAGLARAADLLVEFRGATPSTTRPAATAWFEPLNNLHFRVFVGDLEIGFCEVGGLGDASEILHPREGDRDRDRRKLPGETETDNLVLRRAMTRSKELYHWRRAIVAGKDDRRTLELWQLAVPHGQPVNRWRFTGCWPCRWSGPDFDALFGQVAYEEVEICYDRFDWL